MEKDVFVDKVSALRKQIMNLKHEICNLTDQYIAESEYVKEFPIGSIVKVVDNGVGGTSATVEKITKLTTNNEGTVAKDSGATLVAKYDGEVVAVEQDITNSTYVAVNIACTRNGKPSWLGQPA